MKSKIFYFLIIILSLGMLSGCSLFGALSGSDPVQKDMLDYLNKDLPAVAALEEEAVKLYDSVTGNNYTSDEVLYNTLKDSIMPKYQELIDKVEKIKPATSELQQVHAVYIDGAKKQYKGFEQIIEALEKQDAGIINEANTTLAEGKNQIADYQSKLKDLAQKHDVKITEK